MDERTANAAKVFAADIYATETTGITVEKADRDYARCRLQTDSRHHNANGQVMGGAIFTLADFAFAIASNDGEHEPTVTLSSQINYFSPPKDDVLIAETSCLRSGRGVCVMDILVTDGGGNPVAKVTSTGYRKSK